MFRQATAEALVIAALTAALLVLAATAGLPGRRAPAPAEAANEATEARLPVSNRSAAKRALDSSEGRGFCNLR